MVYTYEEALKASTDYFNGDDLAARVFVDKYALRNENDELIEKTPEDMHWRIAREMARIEKGKFKNPLSEQEIFNLLDKFKRIVMQGSPMYGIGNNYQYISVGNCFLEDTKVYTTSGIKSIQNVELGDQVLTHKNRFRPVVQLHKNLLNDRQLYDIKCYRTPKFTVTGNHKFLSISKEQLKYDETPQWNSIEYLREGDYIAIPSCSVEQPTDQFNMLDIADHVDMMYSEENREYKLEIADDNIGIITHYTINKNNKLFNSSKPQRKINRKWTIDDNFSYFLGLWYGDGCVYSSHGDRGTGRDRRTPSNNLPKGITFTFGRKEEKLIEFVCSYGKQLFGIEPIIVYNEKQNTCQINFKNIIIGLIFEKLFGRKFDGKKIYSGMLSWSNNKKYNLIRGLLDSDGTITKDGHIRIVLANKPLIRDLYFIGRSLGDPVGYSETNYNHGSRGTARLDFPMNSRFVHTCSKSYSDDRIKLSSLKEECKWRLKEIDGIKFVMIDEKIKNRLKPEYVYTLGVEEDHSYCVEGVITQNCFVLPSPYDSYAGIMHTDSQITQISCRRGGVGWDNSKLRPKNQRVTNAARTTSGMVGFAKRFSNTIREVGQHGRRGASLQSLSCYHPEILDFIKVKHDRTQMTGSNISIQFTDSFMESVVNNTDIDLRWPVCEEHAREMNRAFPEITVKESAGKIWLEFIKSAHEMAEPGCMFVDTVHRESPGVPYGQKEVSSNPCGEQWLPPYASCRLLLLNIFGYVVNPYTPNAYFDFNKMSEDAAILQRFGDNLVDLEIECVERIINKIKQDPEPDYIKQPAIDLWENVKRVALLDRRTGCGLTALGDAIAALGMKYGSKESIEFAERMQKEFTLSCYKSSVEMAKELGPFPQFDPSKDIQSGFIQRIKQYDPELFEEMQRYGRRNMVLMTIAPTGSVSCLTQTTSGLEPVFLLSYTRRKKGNPGDIGFKTDFVDANGDHWMHFDVYHRGLEIWMDVTGSKNIKDSPYYGSTANEIDWLARVELQAALQKWVDNAISSTINLPNNVSVETVNEIYLTAWKLGCKGVTIYRDGCRDGVLVSSDKTQKNQDISKTTAPKRPKELPCDIHHIKSRGEDFFVVVGKLNDEIYEVFAGRNGHISHCKKGKLIKLKRGHYKLISDDGTEVDNICDLLTDEQAVITRMLSLALRHGSQIHFIVEQIEKSPGEMTNFGKAVGRILKKYIPDGTKVNGQLCDNCKSDSLVRSEGCIMCKNCGASKCG